MEQYTIYCTKKQTKKAFELGAPIITISEPLYNHPTCGRDWVKVEVQGNSYSAQIPTTEQMIGWLEEQGILILIDTSQDKFYGAYSLKKDNGCWLHRIYLDGLYPTHKEATLNAINAALDYLVNNKK